MEYIDIVIQKRFSRVQYWNDGKSPTLEASCGTGDGNVPMVIAYGVTTKGNGDAFLTEEKHTSLSLGGGQAGQGYPCVLVTDEQGD